MESRYLLIPLFKLPESFVHEGEAKGQLGMDICEVRTDVVIIVIQPMKQMLTAMF
jgi:hypothetical protein